MSGEALARWLSQITQDEFCRRFPELWLLRPFIRAESSSNRFRTGGTHLIADALAPHTHDKLSERLPSRPAKFLLSRLGKCADNPWHDRILIGRAANNDVVLKYDWISKVHAYLELSHGQWLLRDAGSANGTWIAGRRLSASQPAAVESGTALRVANLPCELISSRTLYRSLIKGA